MGKRVWRRRGALQPVGATSGCSFLLPGVDTKIEPVINRLVTETIPTKKVPHTLQLCSAVYGNHGELPS